MDTPHIVSLKPTLTSNNQQIILEVLLENLPTITPNITLTIPHSDDAPSSQPMGVYPSLILSIIDDNQQVVASTFIVENQTNHIEVTLHFKTPPQHGRIYQAQAELMMADEIVETVQTPLPLI